MLYAAKIDDRHLSEQKLLEMAAFYTWLDFTLMFYVVLSSSVKSFPVSALPKAESFRFQTERRRFPFDYFVPEVSAVFCFASFLDL